MTPREIIRNRIKDAFWLKTWTPTILIYVRRVRRDLRRRDLRSAISALLFIEMYRTKIIGLDLSRRMSGFRRKLLSGPIGRIYDDVFEELERVTKHIRKEKRS